MVYESFFRDYPKQICICAKCARLHSIKTRLQNGIDVILSEIDEIILIDDMFHYKTIHEWMLDAPTGRPGSRRVAKTHRIDKRNCFPKRLF